MKPVLSLTIDQLIKSTGCNERLLCAEELEPTLTSLPTWASLFHGFQTPLFPEANYTLVDTIELNEASPFLSYGAYYKDEDSSRTSTSSIPTPPRLKNLLRERICVDTWAQNCSRDAPEHTPWRYSEPVNNDVSPLWKAEGSLIPPSPFKKTLFEIHRLNVPEPDNENEPPQIPLPPVPRRELPYTRLSSSSQSSQSQRQSVSPERAHQLASLPSLKNHLHMRKKSPPLAPSLVARRGKRHLSLLTLPNTAQSCNLAIYQNLDSDDTNFDASSPPSNRKYNRDEKREAKSSVSTRVFDDDLSYPDIPTAFRGIASALPSLFDCDIQIGNESSLELSTMIKNLQEHCEALSLGTSVRMSTPTTGSSNEWQASVDDIINKISTCDGDVSILASSPGGSRYSKTDHPKLSMATSQCLGSFGHSSRCASLFTAASNTKHASRSSPSAGDTADPVKRRPRGILKSTKSVRFAVFSEEISPESMNQSKRLVKHTTHVPSPLRNSFAPEEDDLTSPRYPPSGNASPSPSTLSSRTIRKRFSFSNLASNASEVVTKGKKSLTTPVSRRISAPISRPESFISPRSAPTPKLSKLQQSKLARNRTSGPCDTTVRGNRDKREISNSILARQWSMMDENAVRRNRNSIRSPEKKLSPSMVTRPRQKENSKIPALKSIFTRFK